jgi:DNA polymerase III subunit beta
VDFDAGWTAAGKDLLSLIRHTAFAVSTEESRPVLNGVLWELRDGEMRMVATNGHRLAGCGSRPDRRSRDDHAAHRPPCRAPAGAAADSEGDGGHGGPGAEPPGVPGRDAEVYTRLIEGTYPNYEQVIPKDNDKSAVIQRKLLESAVRRVAAVASDQTHRIRLEFTPGKILFNVLTPDLGEAHDEIEISATTGSPSPSGSTRTTSSRCSATWGPTR